MARLGRRQNTPFKITSVEYLIPLVADDKLTTTELDNYSSTRDFSILEKALKGIPVDDQPLIVEVVPMLPQADVYRPLLGNPSTVATVFRMHVRNFPNDAELQSKIKTAKPGNEFISKAACNEIDYEFIDEVVGAILERSGSKGGDLPLPHSSQVGWRDILTRLKIQRAMTASGKETASDLEENSD